ncbi:MAG: tRNA 2-thiouridine(34) synthase MnmA [Clostridia bacterium]|nr:tRNA 2-thiouridine(34) synthase MnmA [Clostridia bacterium]
MKKALIALSGGVDSAVAAYLTAKAGYDCIGVTMQLLDGCEKNIEDAEKCAKVIGIPFVSVDYQKEFKEKIINDFVHSYEQGETPNPCVLCNKTMKFGLLFDKAKELDCDIIVTGHYAKITKYGDDFFLEKSANTKKDQSYFLYSLSRELLPHIMFPLESYDKSTIREIAAKLGLVSAEKKDSQDICFVQNGEYAKVIESITKKEYPKGDFVDLSGKKLGTHQGLIRYTVGQRKGLGVAFGKPMYVGKKDADLNQVILCEDSELFSTELIAKDFNWLVPQGSVEFRSKARIRYRHEEQPCTVSVEKDTVHISFDQPQRAITPGQSVVLYEGNRIIGGGIIL